MVEFVVPRSRTWRRRVYRTTDVCCEKTKTTLLVRPSFLTLCTTPCALGLGFWSLLASLVVFPDLDSIQQAFPNITADKLGNDLAYPAMLTKLPTGLLGLVLASLISAYMSTISTQLNWGSSYIVYDFYQTQINPDASEKRLVAVGRISTIILMVLSTILALALQNAMQLFNLLLVFGAGTGLIFILRWFWWRINAWSEITAMVASGLISLILTIPSVKASLFGVEAVFPCLGRVSFCRCGDNKFMVAGDLYYTSRRFFCFAILLQDHTSGRTWLGQGH